MKKDQFKSRERAIEEAYFRAQDARLLERLRARATLGELAVALKDKLEIDDPDLLHRIRDLGLTGETSPALLLTPLVWVAWIDSEVDRHARKELLSIAETRGIEPGSPAYATLERWLDDRPPDELFKAGFETIRAGLAVLPPPERDQAVQRVARGCRRVAMAASGDLLSAFGDPWEISHKQSEMIDNVLSRIRA